MLRRRTTDSVAMLEPTRETARRRHPNDRLREHVVIALGPAVTYRRRTSDEYDRKLLELLRETGRINARMARIALDLDVPAASRVLADLVERELLVKHQTPNEASPSPTVRGHSSPPTLREHDDNANGHTPSAGVATPPDLGHPSGRRTRIRPADPSTAASRP